VFGDVHTMDGAIKAYGQTLGHFSKIMIVPQIIITESTAMNKVFI